MSDVDEILTTRGIASTIFDAEGEEMGHILMADFDDGHTTEVVREEVDRPGVNVLLESSPGSYHYYNLGLHPLDLAATELLKTHSDPRHVQIGYRSGRWVLRFAPKRESNGTEYKAAPTLKEAWVNETDRPQSESHFRFFQAFFDLPDLPGEADIRWVGRTYEMHGYATITDELKDKYQSEVSHD